jgi:hypothetical protein
MAELVLRVSTVDVGGPYAQVTGPSPESAHLIYVCGHRTGGHTPACHRCAQQPDRRTALRVWYQSFVDPAEQAPYIDRLRDRLRMLASPGITVEVHGISPDR